MLSVMAAASAVVYRTYYSTEHPASVSRDYKQKNKPSKKIERNSKEIITDPKKVQEFIVKELRAQLVGSMLLSNEVRPVYEYTDKRGWKMLLLAVPVDGHGFYKGELYFAQPTLYSGRNGLYWLAQLNQIKE